MIMSSKYMPTLKKCLDSEVSKKVGALWCSGKASDSSQWVQHQRAPSVVTLSKTLYPHCLSTIFYPGRPARNTQKMGCHSTDR